MDERERPAVQALPVPGQPAAAVQPGDGALDDPALGQDGEALGRVRDGSGNLHWVDEWSFCLTSARMAAEQERR